jgi:alpha/beta superfamily hydrolase
VFPPEERVEIAGAAGALQALYRGLPPGRQPRAAALLCHPHPLFGGTMHNKTLFRIARRLPLAAPVPVLRFNFRGTEQSAGTHDRGRGEVEDARSALDWLRVRVPGVPLAVVGYSFGAAVGLRAGADHDAVGWLVGLGLPLNAEWDLGFLARTRKPRLFVQGEHDQFGSGSELLAWTRALEGPVSVRVVGRADHLFTGREDDAVSAVVRYLTDVVIGGDE